MGTRTLILPGSSLSYSLWKSFYDYCMAAPLGYWTMGRARSRPVTLILGTVNFYVYYLLELLYFSRLLSTRFFPINRGFLGCSCLSCIVSSKSCTSAESSGESQVFLRLLTLFSNFCSLGETTPAMSLFMLSSDVDLGL